MPSHKIEVGEQIDVRAKVFRLFSRDGTGACRRELWCRFDWTDSRWAVSFYKKFGQRDAVAGNEPMTSIPAALADLAAEALRRLAELNDSGTMGGDEIHLPPE